MRLSRSAFAPAYHMNKQHWITIELDSPIKGQRIHDLIDESFNATARVVISDRSSRVGWNSEGGAAKIRGSSISLVLVNRLRQGFLGGRARYRITILLGKVPGSKCSGVAKDGIYAPSET